jgi:hypothetical protein
VKALLTNPYFAILLVPLAVFLALVYARVEPDPISIWGRVYVFGLLAYVGARYVGRAPSLVLQANMAPEARNIVGWAIFIVALMATQIYATLYIWNDRPHWLDSLYWSPSFVVLIGVGITLVASSVPRFPPFGNSPHGLSVISSFFVGLGAGGGMFILAHIGQVTTFLKSLWLGAVHTL